MNLYAIRDAASEKFGPVFEAETDASAVRKVLVDFREIPQEVVKDFKLYFCGEFDRKTGKIWLVKSQDHEPVEVPLFKTVDEKKSDGPTVLSVAKINPNPDNPVLPGKGA